MWIKQILLLLIGLSGGALVASGLFAFIVSLGVVSDFADRTHTGNKILLYENAIILGGILGNIFYIYQIPVVLSGSAFLLGMFGLFSGAFVGCWSMALAEVLNVFPIFIRRVKLMKCVPYMILSIALGKIVGSIIYSLLGW